MDESGSTYLDERDPRKRKRSEDMLREVNAASPPKSRSSSRMNASDNWAQRAEAFIHKVVNDPPPSNETSRSNPSMGYGHGAYNYGVVGYPNYPHHHHHGGYPPPQVNLNASSYNSHYKGSVEVKEDKDTSSDPGNNHTSSKGLKRKSRREESSTTSSSSSSDSEEGKGKKISSEQRSKLKIQKEQYEKAQEKLEAQLIKLKEQREALKEGGAKHEDKIMKDNARLQKEVKNRLSHMKEVLDKIVIGLDDQSKVRNKSSSREHSSDKSKRKKKKRHRGRSVSDDDCDDDDDSESKESRKKHKKKKKKYRSSSSSEDSDSEHERKKSKKKAKGDIDVPLDDSIFRMMSELKNLKSSKKGDETFMDLLGKMSEAYMKAKQENNELSHRINALESENQLLKKKQLEDRASISDSPKKWDVRTSHVIEVVEPKRKKKEDILEEIKKISKKKDVDDDEGEEDTSRSVRSKMIEKEENARTNDMKKNGDSGPRKSKERSVSKERDRRSRSRDYSYSRRRDYSPDRRNRYRRRSSRRSRSRERKRDYSRSRSKERRSSSRDSRSRSSKDDREKSKSREFKTVKDRNDKINLDEWAEKPATEKDPSLMSLKEKMMIKEKESEQQKKQWAAVSEVKSPKSVEEPIKEMVEVEQHQQQPLTTSRPQVAIQWGQGIKKGSTPEPMQPSKKTQPLVGKMPWLQKGTKKPGESRFGPPTTMSNIPPPGVLSTVPTPFGLLTPEEVTPVPPPPPPPIPKKNPPKNPTPQAMDMNAMLAAAQAHMRARSEEFVSPEMEIPLPPLPAATDKDPDALNDTRPPKVPTPPPVREKTEMEIMIEKHCPGTDVNDYTNNTYTDAPKISSKFDLPPGEEDMDPSELAMLGIDPSDLAGFGK